MEKGFQVEREILEICYNNGYLPQKNKPKIEHDDTIDIEPKMKRTKRSIVLFKSIIKSLWLNISKLAFYY
ncbi:hypothetical protein HpBhutan199_05860 [Helicobacter pylori]